MEVGRIMFTVIHRDEDAKERTDDRHACILATTERANNKARQRVFGWFSPTHFHPATGSSKQAEQP